MKTVLFFSVLAASIFSGSIWANGPCEEIFEGSDFQWLENTGEPNVTEWVNAANAEAVARLTKDPRFEEVRQNLVRYFSDSARTPGVLRIGNFLYNEKQDEKNPRGIFRRTTLDEFRKPEPKWETVLDLDELSVGKNEGFALASVGEEKSFHRRAMINLSVGGRDAVVIREFDLEKKEFVKDGFEIPEGLSSFTWLDEDTLLVGAKYGEGSTGPSNYPITVRVWKRGTPLSEAREIFRGDVNDIGVWSYMEKDQVTGKRYFLIKRWIGGDSGATYSIDSEMKVRELPVPEYVHRKGVSNGQMLFISDKDWILEGRTFRAGDLLQIPVDKAFSFTKEDVIPVFETDAATAISQVVPAGDRIYLVVRQNVTDQLHEARWVNGRLKFERIRSLENATVSIQSVDQDSGEVLLSMESFLQPPSIYRLIDGKLEILREGKHLFNAGDLKSEQLWAKSADGTMIPYFLVRKNTLEFNGQNPTLLYGYGGFNHALTPHYEAFWGRTLLEKGGVYVPANIRGGNEFGPAWHEAAMREKFFKAFEDFEAIAQDLVQRGITSAPRLAINGGSNGGRLVASVAVRKPELCNGVLCEVPVLDMLRFHKLLAGSGWISEWGNPEDPHDAAYLRSYSPFHNISRGRSYPEIFFRTSTADDRVHPAHARKMYARLKALGYPALIYESGEGGHTSTATVEERAFNGALEVIYIYQKIF